MSAKPTIALARWGDQISANLVAPTSGERDLGFGSGTPASAGKVNWQINQLYQWALYLNDGVLSGNIELNNNLKVDGTTELVGVATIDGNATVGGTLGVTGATTLTGALGVNGGASVPSGKTLSALGVSVFDGTFALGVSSQISLTAGNNNNVAWPGHPVMSFTPNAGGSVITGMVPPSVTTPPGASSTSVLAVISLASATGTFQITHQDANSTSGNRFVLPGGTTLTFPSSGLSTAVFLYNLGNSGGSNWFLIFKNF